MTELQKAIKYFAIALAIILSVSIIGGLLSAIGLLDGVFYSDAILEDTKTYSVSNNIVSIDFTVNAATLTIKEGDSFSLESNLKYLSLAEKDGVLTLKDRKKSRFSYNGAIITLIIPSGTVFERVAITTGAGRLSADCISAESLKLVLGAGEVSFEELSATKKAKIEGGAGKIKIMSGTIHSLELDMGIGELDMRSALTGVCELELGIGESNITLIGNKEDHAIDIDKGIGSVTLDGEKLSSYRFGTNMENILNIDGGIGNINIIFEKDTEK